MLTMLKNVLKVSVDDFLLFLFSPALSFVTAVKKIYYGKFSACWIVPYIMGMLAYLFPPYSDFSRNLDLVYKYKDLSLSQFYLYFSDLIIPGVERFFVLHNIPIEFFRFIYTYIVYWWVTDIFYDLNKICKFDKNKGFLIWAILFMSISFFVYVINIRTLLVSYILFYGLYKYLYKRKNKYVFLLIFAAFVHIAYFPIVIISIFSKFITFSIPRKIKILLFLTLIIFNYLSDMSLFLSLVKMLPLNDLLASKVEIYTIGEWSASGDMTKDMQTTNFVIYKTLTSLSTYYVLYLYIKYDFHTCLDSYHSLLLIMLLIVAPVPSIFSRYFAFFISATLLHLILGYSKGLITNKIMRRLLFLNVFATLLDIYANWNCLVNGYVYFLLLPVPFALFQIYDFQDWCRNHLSLDFNQFINKTFLSR